MMEATIRRLRLKFHDPNILSKTQKKNGLKHSWIFLKPHHETISDVAAYIIHSFDLHESCPHGLILYMDGFVLPPFESTTILKDKDLISVKRKGLGTCDTMKAIEGAMPSLKNETVDKQLLPSGVRLLANEEFDKETVVYQSVSDKDDEAGAFVECAPDGDVAFKKRKATSPIEMTKKRQRCLTSKDAVKKDNDHEPIKTLQKKRKLANGSKREIAVDCTNDLEPRSKSNEPEEKREETINGSGVPKSKQACRSSRRKKLQRQWRKLRNSNMVEDVDQQLPANCLGKDPGSRKDEQLVEEDGDADDGDLVPVEICPGHVRFISARKAKDLNKNEEASGWDVQKSQKVSDWDVQKNKEANGWGVQKNKKRNGYVQKNQGANGSDLQSIGKKAWEGHTAKKNVWGVDKNKMTRETSCWSEITNKRKAQNWGKENQPVSWKESRDYNGASSSRATTGQPSFSWKQPRDRSACTSSTGASGRKQPNDASLEFEKFMPLTDLPKVGDIIAYRLLELSSSWCPELTSFRVGKITSFDQESNKTILVPEAQYPLNLPKRAVKDHADDDDSGQPPQPSFYNEDGSLEIDFPSLVNVRIVKRSDSSQSGGTVLPAANGTFVSSEMSKGASETDNQEQHTPATPVNGKKDVWEEISEALTAKKALLTQEDNWNKKPSSAKQSWSHRTLKSRSLGSTMTMLRA
ncbi:unnamed protein product [Amaranthus hypochondriacus]